ncbi:hypothetical protein KY366_08105, partial [Candidatus Woesearchaeota archaeon]|nr:hypothetical protein [Candidatus Woesearchaeota archaeon]
MTIDQDVKKYMEENMTDDSAGEFLLNKGVQNHIQINLFEPLVKDGNDPDWDKTKYNLAKKGMEEKDVCIGDMDYINKVGIAATGFRPKKAQPGYNDDVERFMYENMTHISAEEYFSNKGAEDGTKPDKVQ